MELVEALKLKTTQNVTPKRIARLQKQTDFITLLFRGHITFAQAARQIGISRRQAYRWFTKWKQNEGLEIDREWWQLYNTLLDQNPTKAFEGLTRLKYRMTTQTVEVKEDIKVEEKHVTVIADYTGAIEAAVKRDIQSLRAEQQMDTAQTDNQTS